MMIQPRHLLLTFITLFLLNVHLESRSSFLVFEDIVLTEMDTTPSQSSDAQLPGQIWKVVEEMPLFNGCDLPNSTLLEKKQCSDVKLINYIIANVKYPKKARKRGTEGKVYVRFIVDSDGSVVDPEIVRDIGNGCGEAALKVVKSFPKWIPGKKDGKAVRVLYTLPFTFGLTG